MAELTGGIRSARTPAAQAARLGAVGRLVAVGLFAGAVVVAALVGVPAAETPGVTTRESVRTGTTDVAADDDSRNAVVSADGRWVAFDSAAENLTDDAPNDFRDVFLRDRQNGETVLASLTPGGERFLGDALNPSISANGRHVAFEAEVPRPPVEIDARNELERLVYTSNEAGSVDVYTSWGDGSDPRQLTDTPEAESDPAFSPDRSRIAFSRDGEIWVMDADGESASQLTVSPDGTFSDQPAWAPDGRRVVFRRGFEEDTGWQADPPPTLGGGLFVVGLDGDEPTQLTDSAFEFDGDAWPDWSPDGRWVAFSNDNRSDDVPVEPGIFVVEVVHDDGEVSAGDVSRVTTGDDRQPRWHPWRGTLVFARTASEGDASSIWMVDVGPAPPVPESASARAFGAQVDLADGPPVGPLPEVAVQVPEAGPRADERASVLDLDLSPVGTAGATRVRAIGDLDPLSGGARGHAETADVTLLENDVTEPLIEAEAIHAMSTTVCSDPDADHEAASAGSRFVNLRVGDTEVPLNPAPNTEITIPGVAAVTVRQVEQGVNDRGEPETIVRGLHVNLLSESGEITVAQAESAVQCEETEAAEGLEPQKLTDGGGSHSRPAWTGEGLGMTFASDRSGDSASDLYRVPVSFEPFDVGDPERVTDGNPLSGEGVTEAPHHASTHLSFDTPAGMSVTVRGGAGQPTPQGSVAFEVFRCGDVEAASCAPPEEDTRRIGGLVSLTDRGNGTTSGTSPRTSAMTPPYGFGEPDTHCLAAHYSGDHFYRSVRTTELDELCFRTSRHQPDIDLAVATDGLSTAATATVTASTGVATPTGAVSFHLCGPLPSGAGCVEGGGPVGGVQPLEGGQASSVSVTVEEPGLYCWRVAYTGDFVYHALSYADNASTCVVLGLDGQVEPELSGTIPSGGELAPGTPVRLDATISAGGGAGSAPPGRGVVWLCGPDEVDPEGCATGGTQVAEVALGSDADFSALAPGALTDTDGSHCFRIDYRWAEGVDPTEQEFVEKSHTNNLNSGVDPDGLCFDVVSEPFDLSTSRINVFVHDRDEGETVLVSRALDGGPADGDSHQPSIAADGRMVAFTSEASDLTADTGLLGENVFVRDLDAGETTLASVHRGICPCPGNSREPSLSARAGFVAFSSDAGSLDVSDSPGADGLETTQILVRDLDAGVTTIESLGPEGQPGEGDSFAPSLSGDGSRVAFTSAATDLVGGDGNGVDDVFLRDRQARKTTRVSLGATGAEANDSSGEPSISSDGRTVGFASQATNLVADDPCAAVSVSAFFGLALLAREATAACGVHVYVHDTVSGVTGMVSVDSDGEPPAGGADSRRPSLSRDGRYVAFDSDAPALAQPPATAELRHVYVRDRTPVLALSPDPLAFGEQLVGRASAADAVTAANTGSGPLRIDAVAVTDGDVDDYAVDALECVDTTLFQGDECTLRVEFAPTAEGERTAVLTVDSTDTRGRLRVTLTGSGTRARLTVTPDRVDFGEQLVDTTSDPRTVTFRSVGSAPVTVADVAVGGTEAADFLVTADGCTSAVLAPEHECTVELRMRPAVSGPRVGRLVLTSSAEGSPHEVGLTGTGIRGLVEASPDPLDFGRQEQGRTSGPRVVTLRSVGQATITVEQVMLAGGHVSDFAAEDDCTDQVLDPGGTCTVTLRFTPSAVGTRDGRLVFAHDGEGDPGGAFGLDSAVTTVSLTGVGIPGPGEDAALLTVTPDPVDFGVVPAEQDSTPRTVTVTSVGTIPARIDRVRIRGSAAEHFAAISDEDGCSGQTLAPETTCELVVVFRPAATGSHLAFLTVASDAEDAPNTVGLRGLAPLLIVDPPLGPPGFVTGVTGSDFPAGTELVLAWKPGIGRLRVATDDTGGFRAHMLVLHRDQLGTRQLEARGDGFAIPADFLVVPGSAQPGDFQTRR